MADQNFRTDKEWFRGLQREGWRMELLISGFSLVLLLKVPDALAYWQEYINVHIWFAGDMETLLIGLLGILSLASKVLVINLIINIFLRGFWIGTIGLHSVQDHIPIKKLSFSKPFEKYLEEKLTPLSELTKKIDELCSVIFSFSFLIVFMLLSFFLYFIIISIFSFLLIKFSLLASGLIAEIISLIGQLIVLLIILSGIIYLVDTLSLGALKRFQKFSPFYFFMYRFISKLTLARYYRSIYYSLITRFSGWQVTFFLIPYLLFLVIYSTVDFDQYSFFPEEKDDSYWQTNVYDDQRPTKEFIKKASIPSEKISNSFLPLFIRYPVDYNEEIENYCQLEPMHGAFNINLFEPATSPGLRTNDTADQISPMLACLTNYFSVKLDQTDVFPDANMERGQTGLPVFWYLQPVNDERGIRMMLDIDTLTRGQHWIEITRPVEVKQDSFFRVRYVRFPFWKE